MASYVEVVEEGVEVDVPVGSCASDRVAVGCDRIEGASAAGSGSIREQGSSGDPITERLTRMWPEERGIPVHFREAFRVGGGEDVLKRWHALGCPASMRAEKSARRRQALSLEHKSNNVQHLICITGKGCRRHACPKCGRAVGIKTRSGMRVQMARLQREYGCQGDVQMWTLTVDPKLFVSAEAAWEHVNDQRLIARMMKSLGVHHYVWVLEWHRSGWPHWHVLIWMPIERMYIDQAQVKRLWKVGQQVRFTTRFHEGKVRPIIWAINYATKYLCKPHHGAPEWVMHRSRVRMVASSRAFGPVVTCDGDDDQGPDDNAAGAALERAAALSIGRAVELCCSTCVVVEEFMTDDGVLHRRWLRNVPVPLRVMRRLVAKWSGSSRIRRQIEIEAGGVMHRRLQSIMPLLR